MADAQLSTSISSISERASEVAQAASADELYKLSRVAPSLEQSENATLEVAINTRAAAIAGSRRRTRYARIRSASPGTSGGPPPSGSPRRRNTRL